MVQVLQLVLYADVMPRRNDFSFKPTITSWSERQRILVYIPIQVGWNTAGMQGGAAADWKFCGSAGPVYIEKLSSVTRSDQDQSVYGPAQGVYRQCEFKF